MMLPFETASPTPDLSSSWVVSPGIEGFAMLLVLAVATILLIRSMLSHVRKATFNAAKRAAAQPAAGSPAQSEPEQGTH